MVWKDSKTISKAQITSEVSMEEDADSEKQLDLLSISSIKESTHSGSRSNYDPDLEMRNTRSQIEPVYDNFAAKQSCQNGLFVGHCVIREKRERASKKDNPVFLSRTLTQWECDTHT